MANYSRTTINTIYKLVIIGTKNQERGRGFEDLVSYVFQRIPGISIAERNIMNTFQNEEIDITLWNDKKNTDLYFLPNIILVECKNWSHLVSIIEVNWFLSKLEYRGNDFGILVANNGITGDPEGLRAS